MTKGLKNTPASIAFNNYVYHDTNQRATKHDESGQVFTEVSRPGGPMTLDWLWKTQGSSREAARFRSPGPGCASLINMAIRSALIHSINITAESFENLPWEVAKLLWESLVASQLVSVKVWKAFAVAYPNEDVSSLKRKHHVIVTPNMKLGNYIAPLISTSLQWITFLSLSNISRTDLVKMSELKNLGVLTIGRNLIIAIDTTTADIGLDESIIRGWGRAASKSDAFGLLRVLNCRSQKNITATVFAHLNQFPALSLFNIEDCDLGPEHRQAAQDHGWKYKTGKDLSDWLAKGGGTGAGWDSIVHASFQLGAAFSEKTMKAEYAEQNINATPVLHMSVGAAQPDALLDVKGCRKFRSFHREQIDTNNFSNKRPLSENIATSKTSRKKPSVRVAKQQKMEDLLIGFEG